MLTKSACYQANSLIFIALTRDETRRPGYLDRRRGPPLAQYLIKYGKTNLFYVEFTKIII